MSQDSGALGQYGGMGGGSDVGNRYSGNFDSPGGYGLQQGMDDRVSATRRHFCEALAYRNGTVWRLAIWNGR